MEFEEPSDSGFPVALGAPGQLDVTEKALDRLLASSLMACTVATMHAPNPTKAKVDSAVMLFSLHSMHTPAARSAAPITSSSTIH